MRRLRQVSRAEVDPKKVVPMYDFLFGDRDPVADAGTATGTSGDWWTVFALVPDIFDHCVKGFGVYRSPKRKIDPLLRELGQTRAGWLTESQFVYLQHLKSCRGLGVAEEKIQAIQHWQVADCFDERERTLLAYTDYLVDQGQHFFFDIGNHDHLAFFWFPDAGPSVPGVSNAGAMPGGAKFVTAHGSMNHLAFNVPLDNFFEYRDRLRADGVEVSGVLDHDESAFGIARSFHDESSCVRSISATLTGFCRSSRRGPARWADRPTRRLLRSTPTALRWRSDDVRYRLTQLGTATYGERSMGNEPR